MQHSFDAMTHTKVAAQKGNINTITDAGVAAHALMAAMEGAALNVRINLDNISDKSFINDAAKTVEKILSEGSKLKKEVLEIVEARMKELAESS
ncbi:MAG: glutamate formimidoyltransferase, partial [Candidatus Thorarchaeota archaeon]